MVRLIAPAKLTVSLHVTGVRADGYHLLDAEMVSVDLADVLEIGPGRGVEVVDEVLGGSGTAGLDGGDTNLVARALAAVGREAAVRLVKRIPVGAGLGGGSADAAAVLRWAGCDDSAVAVGLGADVPFCVVGGRARVQGIGEVVTPLEHLSRTFVVLVPPLSVDTAAAYRAFDAGARVVDDWGNDLEAAALAVEPRLAPWRDAMAEQLGCRPRLAGSGASWFVEAEGLGEVPDTLLVGDERAPLVKVGSVRPLRP